ncbi:bifunctional diguanylate cyclase/phosphodiesterase [Thiomicrorhabdus heinhorstiae]|uniref:EAL domain-containing protein n=1 Tax=Thiomicrorhabdus heinhorstiae TaxID=2748010 RepID=A0ABS0BXH0_9GAMM|nr:LapD/MoxY N-terminal periplasmic domain-containing protein [Thiomicrorhabdus heinhorstiae]MBF6057546.1 EAL domain-containing protein [Thiomicrorhabdus heinhorstiae]
MSLYKQISLLISSILLVLLAGIFILNLASTKQFLQEQLGAHAQDTATSLGLSLSTIPDPNDLAVMETMINAVFDRGYYKQITLTDMDGKVLYHRQNAKQIEGIPSWFINQIPLKTPEAQAMVQAGWTPLGTLSVTSHPGYAYVELWQNFLNLMSSFGIAAVLSILLLVLSLKLLLSPLKRVQEQAKAVVDKEYILQEKLPKTMELRQVVIAMNTMIEKLKAIFDRDAAATQRLQKLAYQDQVTEFSNRKHFEMVFDSFLDIKQEMVDGSIALLHIHKLKELNNHFGYANTDNFIRHLAGLLKENFSQHNISFGRLNGSEIAVLVPGKSPRQIRSVLEEILSDTPNTLQGCSIDPQATYLSSSVCRYSPGKSRASVMSQLDFGIQQLRDKHENLIYIEDAQSESNEDLAQEKHLLDQYLQQSFLLFEQPVVDRQGDQTQMELLLRMQESDGTLRSAAFFIPLFEKFERMAELDSKTIELCHRYLEKHDGCINPAVNISLQSLQDESSRSRLLEQLARLPSPNASIELPEQLILNNKTLVTGFIQQATDLGIRIGIDHFGSHFANILYLQKLKPDYIKLDASFARSIESNEMTRNYVEKLRDMTSHFDIKIIAMAVETEAQRQAFDELGIDGFQGYLFGAPQKLS